MSLKHNLGSEVQLPMDLIEEGGTRECTDCTDDNAFLSELEYLNDEDEQLLSLLEEILTEVFVNENDTESLEALEGNAIYNLDDEREIERRIRYEVEALNEGSPDVEELDKLEELSKAYFARPNYYPLTEDDFEANHCTGFVQIYSGEKFDASGKMKEQWKSFNKKVLVRVSDLMDPDLVIEKLEAQGIKWGPIFRVVFYGSPLVEVVGSRFYNEKDSRELLPLTESHKNILLALPDYEETEADSESIYDWVDKQFQEGIAFGVLPDVDRITVGHWELTSIRLQEIQEEELEEKSLSRIMKKETLAASRQNQFLETYSDARSIIKGLNQGSVSIDIMYSLELKTLDEILFLCARSFERINDPLVYAQIRSQATRLTINKLQASNSLALSIIQKINSGALIELHLIPSKDIESIFEILWGNSGIRILPEYKEIYYQLKERLRVIRAKSGTSYKGRAG